jgi:integrase
MPWDKHDFPRARLDQKLPWSWPPTKFNVAADLLRLRTAHLRSRSPESLRYRQQTQTDPRPTRQRGKDRYTILSPCLLELLRAYYRILRPAGEWLYPSCARAGI